MKLKNITNLRDFALKTLEDLSSGKIDTSQAGVTGKLCEGVVSTIKCELEYSRMLNKQPNIPFMGDLTKNKDILIEGAIPRKLSAPSKQK